MVNSGPQSAAHLKEGIRCTGQPDIERMRRVKRYTMNRGSGSFGPDNVLVAVGHFRRLIP